MSYLILGRKADGGPSGIAEREDTVMLGLGGNSEDVEDDGEGDTELRDDRLLGVSGIKISPTSPGGNLEEQQERCIAVKVISNLGIEALKSRRLTERLVAEG